jgi:hypothetical protein
MHALLRIGVGVEAAEAGHIRRQACLRLSLATIDDTAKNTTSNGDDACAIQVGHVRQLRPAKM